MWPNSCLPSATVLVDAAQAAALKTAKAGVEMRKVDEAARESLETTGYASYFTHRLGHGEWSCFPRAVA